MRRRGLIAAFAAALLATGASAQPASMPRVAIIHTGTLETDRPFRDSFAQGMRERGYVHGKNMILEEAYA